uniref:Uncharacterized protein n=1 Tax=Sciurus vulgaris TaxID=55149 RepID=A0A8D2D817_SCIVU
MRQERPARRLPSLLVDPAEQTVHRRCRDPINVESLLPLKIRFNLEDNVQYVSMRKALKPGMEEHTWNPSCWGYGGTRIMSLRPAGRWLLNTGRSPLQKMGKKKVILVKFGSITSVLHKQ